MSIQTKYNQFIGQQLGKLKIKEVVITKAKNNHSTYGFVCDCSCGNKDLIKDCSSVKAGRATSCGCRRRNYYNTIVGKDSPLFTGHEEISGKYWASLKQSAKLRGHDILLTIEQAWDLFIEQNRKCTLTGVLLTFPKSTRTTDWSLSTASLDRIDSDKQYEIGNVQWVHKDINLMKQQYTSDYFIYMCHMVAASCEKPTKPFDQIKKGGRYGKKPKLKGV